MKYVRLTLSGAAQEAGDIYLAHAPGAILKLDDKPGCVLLYEGRRIAVQEDHMTVIKLMEAKDENVR